MLKIRLTPTGEIKVTQLTLLLSKWASHREAKIVPQGTLRTYLGCRHWHITGASRGSGTVEVTLISNGESEVWVVVHANRRGSWAEEAHKRLAHFLIETGRFASQYAH